MGNDNIQLHVVIVGVIILQGSDKGWPHPKDITQLLVTHHAVPLASFIAVFMMALPRYFRAYQVLCAKHKLQVSPQQLTWRTGCCPGQHVLWSDRPGSNGRCHSPAVWSQKSCVASLNCSSPLTPCERGWIKWNTAFEAVDLVQTRKANTP